MASSNLSDAVLAAYNAKAVQALSPEAARRVAAESGYSIEDVADGELIGLSCGNPIAVASLKPDETVVDLGCGAGFDILQAARKVGSDGFAIGLDAAPNMIDRARANAHKAQLRPPHVAFASADLTDKLPLQDSSVDVFISNCVVNLLSTEDKSALFREMHRCLKTGGRIAISDILARRPMSAEVLDSFAARVGCIGGAITVDKQRELLIGAGFNAADVVLIEKRFDLNVYFAEGSSCAPCCSSKTPSDLPDKFNANDHAASYDILALKRAETTPFADTFGDGPLASYNLAFPPPVAKCASLKPSDAADAIRANESKLLIVDTRRADYKESTVRGAINWPAQRIPVEIDQLVERARDYERVAFFCGSSRGRGPRSAAYLQDALNARGLTSPVSLVLEGGINAWRELHGDDAELVTRLV